jgi:hypothetical protein
MSKAPRSLEIDEDVVFQRKEWIFQRIGLGALFLFVVAALLGLTGMGGPLSRGHAGDSNGPLHVEYERFVRRGSSSKVTLHLRGAPGSIRFWVSAPYLEHVQIDSVAPAPDLESVEAHRHIYQIQAGSSDVTVTLNLTHEEAGSLEAEVGLVDGPSVRFTQYSIF